MQSGREAVRALLAGKPAEYVPGFDYLWSDTRRKWRQEDGLPEDTDFGFDLHECGGWFKLEPMLDETILEENAEWKIVRNGAGAVLKWWKQKSGTPEHIDFDMSSRAIWEQRYRPLLLDTDPVLRLNEVDKCKGNLLLGRGLQRWTFFGCAGIWEQLRKSLGDYNMMVALVEEPDWIHDFNRVYTDLYKTCYRLLFEKVGMPDGVWIYEDLGYRDRLFCSPDILKDLFFPYYREMTDFFHGYGVSVVLHSCGYQAPAVPLVVDAGFDALHPMEVKAGNRIFDYVEKYGDRLAFFGGMDARILESGSRDVIRKGVTDFMSGMKARGARFVYGTDHSVSPNVRLSDFRYACEVYRGLR
jgi:uroporphyrinogen decarboxylase